MPIDEARNLLPHAKFYGDELCPGEQAPGFDIRDERARAELYEADRLHLANGFCQHCGARFQDGECPYGCEELDIEPEEIDLGLLTMYDEDLAACDRARGNYTKSEVAYMRHPD